MSRRATGRATALRRLFWLSCLALFPGPTLHAAERDWTLLVYIDGDNNLEPFALLDLNEMEAAYPGQNLEVLVLLDRAEGYSKDLGDWTGTRLYRVRRDDSNELGSELLQELPEANMGDPATLRQFLVDGIRAYPAKHYGLILWDHGGGWSNHVNDEDAPGAEGDYDYLTLAELRGAVEQALQATAVARLDLVGFDMCLMGQLEVAYELAEVARFMVASQALEPGDGWPYDRVLPLFAAGKPTAAIATGIVDAFDDFYRARNEAVTTLAAYDLAHAGATVDALDILLGDLQGRLPALWRELVRSLFFAESYNDIGDYKRGANALQSIDLRHALATLAASQPGLADSAPFRGLGAALDRLVLTSRNSPRHRASRGVAIYAPYRSDLLNGDYAATRFGTRSRWLPTLQALHGQQVKSPGELQIHTVTTWSGTRDQAVDDVIQLGQDGFLYDFTTRNALRTLAWRGMPDAEGRLILFHKTTFSYHQEAQFARVEARDKQSALAGFTVPDGRNGLFDRYDGSQLVVTNGRDTALGMVDESDIEARENGFYYVAVIYEHPEDGKYSGTLRFNWLWQADNLTLALPNKDGSYSYVSASPKPEAKIHLLADSYTRKGELEQVVTGTLPWGDGLRLSLTVLEPGTYSNIFGLEDLAGNTAFKRHDFRLSPRQDPFLDALDAANLRGPNFVGEWTVVDARTWFEQKRLVPVGGKVHYSAVEGNDALLVKRVEKENEGVVSPEGTVELLATAGIAHSRTYVLAPDGTPDRGWGVRAALPVFDQTGDDFLLLSMDLSDGSVGVMVKTAGPQPQLASVTPPPPATAPPSAAPAIPAAVSLDGVWQSPEGTALAFEGNQWALFESGVTTDGGIYQISGNVLQSQSQYTGQIAIYQFQTDGQQLLLQDAFGNVYSFYRAR